MKNINILTIDNRRDNMILVKGGLAKVGFDDKNLFPKNNELDSILKDIEKWTANSAKKIIHMAKWLNDYVIYNSIDILILDLALCEDEECDPKNTQSTSGIRLINSLIPEVKHESIEITQLNYLPVIILSGMPLEGIDIETKANIVHSISRQYTDKTVNFDEILKKNNDELMQIIISQGNKYKFLKDNNCFKNNDKFDYDLAIICAIKKEFDYIKDLSDSWDELKINGKTYYKTYFIKDKKKISVIAKTENEMGMAESATLATTMINYFNPQYIAMTGIAAGIKNEGINLGDIVIPKMVWNWQSGKFKIIDDESVFDRDDIKLPLDESLADAAEKIKDDNSFLADLFENFKNDINKKSKLSVRPCIVTENMVSGSAVVADSSIVKKEIGSRKLVSIDMEAYGVFYAAKKSTKNGAEAIVIKSICDFADDKKNDDYQEFSAYASAQTLYKLVTEHIEFDISHD